MWVLARNLVKRVLPFETRDYKSTASRDARVLKTKTSFILKMITCTFCFACSSRVCSPGWGARSDHKDEKDVCLSLPLIKNNALAWLLFVELGESIYDPKISSLAWQAQRPNSDQSVVVNEMSRQRQFGKVPLQASPALATKPPKEEKSGMCGWDYLVDTASLVYFRQSDRSSVQRQYQSSYRYFGCCWWGKKKKKKHANFTAGVQVYWGWWVLLVFDSQIIIGTGSGVVNKYREWLCSSRLW